MNLERFEGMRAFLCFVGGVSSAEEHTLDGKNARPFEEEGCFAPMHSGMPDVHVRLPPLMLLIETSVLAEVKREF